MLFVAMLFLSCAVTAKSEYRILHHFTGGTEDGATPMAGALVLSGDKLYGTTETGGADNVGTCFTINTDGTNFQLLHSFLISSSDGQTPYASLVKSGSTLYGTATSYGASYGGTLFRIETNGSDFQVLRRFADSDGIRPYGTPIVSGSVIYGTNTYGGSVSKGTIFKINNDGTGFQLLHTFTGSTGDGASPYPSLLLLSDILYGTTNIGGSNNLGTVFKINTNGSGYQLLHHFTGGGSNGSYPCFGRLIQIDSTLYGMTCNGGANNSGTIYKINTDGTGFQILHSFSGGISDVALPTGSLTNSGQILYGMTLEGGTGNGTIFQIKTDGSEFEIIHSFSGSNGKFPQGDLTQSGPTLYGMTNQGGDYNKGVIFAFDLEFADCNEVKEAGFRLDADIYGDGDCYVDFYDFSIFAQQWLYCNNPQDANCIP